MVGSNFRAVVWAMVLAIAMGAGAVSAQDQSQIRIVRLTAPDNIDPATTCTIFGGSLVNNLYDRLVEYRRTDAVLGPEVEPMVAEEWTKSADGLEYRFKIRSGLTFSSGNPLTPADVVYSLQRTLKMGGCQGYNLEGGQTGNISSIEEDGNEVVVRFKRPDPLFLTNLTNNIGIIDSNVLEANGGLSEAGAAWLSANAAGSGPFTLKSYDPEALVELQARQDYWKGAPGSQGIVIQIARDPSALELLLSSGSADVAYDVASQDVARLAENPELQVVSGPALTFVNIGFNTTKSPLNDVRVRQALTYATPIEAIISTFAGDYGHPLVGPIMEGQPYHVPLDNPFAYDPDRARELIKDAGVEGTTLSLVIKAGQSVQTEIATVLQDAWREVGINLEVRTLGSSAFFDEIGTLKHQMYMIEDKSANPDPGYLLSFFVRCGDPYNWTGYCDKDVDVWLSEAREAQDDAARAKAYESISRQVTKDAPYLQLFQKDQVVLTRKGIVGLAFSPESEDRLYWLKRQ